MADFKVYLNRRKTQWVDVFLWDVHPTTFANWGGGRWGYFEATWKNPKKDLFGEVHFVKPRIRPDLVVHEFDHVRTEWMYSNGFTITRQNEERMCSFLDRMVGNFYREWNKLTRGQK